MAPRRNLLRYDKVLFYHTTFPTDVKIPFAVPSQVKNAEHVVTNQAQIDAWVKQDILAQYYLTATIETQPMKCGQGFLFNTYRMQLKINMPYANASTTTNFSPNTT